MGITPTTTGLVAATGILSCQLFWLVFGAEAVILASAAVVLIALAALVSVSKASLRGQPVAGGSTGVTQHQKTIADDPGGSVGSSGAVAPGAAVVVSRSELGVAESNSSPLAEVAEFHGSVVHDLRNGLLALQGGMKALEVTEGSQRLLCALREEAERLRAILEQQKNTVSPTNFDVVEALRPHIDVLRADGADIRFAPELCAVARGRSQLVVRAVQNLIGNALTHGGGEVEVRVSSRVRQVEIVVMDRGPGLGELGVAALRRGVSGSGGSGLGLAITAEIVAAEGGTFVVSPRRGGGLVAAVTLPVAAVPDAPSAVPDAPSAVPDAPLAVSDAPLAVSDAPLAVSDAPLAVSDAPLAVPDAPLAVPDAVRALDDLDPVTAPASKVTDSAPVPHAGAAVASEPSGRGLAAQPVTVLDAQ